MGSGVGLGGVTGAQGWTPVTDPEHRGWTPGATGWGGGWGFPARVTHAWASFVTHPPPIHPTNGSIPTIIPVRNLGDLGADAGGAGGCGGVGGGVGPDSGWIRWRGGGRGGDGGAGRVRQKRTPASPPLQTMASFIALTAARLGPESSQEVLRAARFEVLQQRATEMSSIFERMLVPYKAKQRELRKIDKVASPYDSTAVAAAARAEWDAAHPDYEAFMASMAERIIPTARVQA